MVHWNDIKNKWGAILPLALGNIFTINSGDESTPKKAASTLDKDMRMQKDFDELVKWNEQTKSMRRGARFYR